MKETILNLLSDLMTIAMLAGLFYLFVWQI